MRRFFERISSLPVAFRNFTCVNHTIQIAIHFARVPCAVDLIALASNCIVARRAFTVRHAITLTALIFTLVIRDASAKPVLASRKMRTLPAITPT